MPKTRMDVEKLNAVTDEQDCFSVTVGILPCQKTTCNSYFSYFFLCRFGGGV